MTAPATAPPAPDWWVLLGSPAHARRWHAEHPEVPRRQVIVLSHAGDERRVQGVAGRVQLVELHGWEAGFRGCTSYVLALVESRNRPA